MRLLFTLLSSLFNKNNSGLENKTRFAFVPKKVITEVYDFIPVKEKTIFLKFFKETPEQYGIKSRYSLDCKFDN